MEFENISINDFLNLDGTRREEYNFYLRYSVVTNKPVDHFKVGDMTERTFGLIKDLQYDMSHGMTWVKVVEYMKIMTTKDASLDLATFMQQWTYIKKEIERITEIEDMLLAYTPDDDEVRAGIENLSELGSYLQFRQIAQSLNLTIDQVKEMRYDEGFLELVTQKRLSDYERELVRIKREHIRK